jgi:hypothetical protein
VSNWSPIGWQRSRAAGHLGNGNFCYCVETKRPMAALVCPLSRPFLPFVLRPLSAHLRRSWVAQRSTALDPKRKFHLRNYDWRVSDLSGHSSRAIERRRRAAAPRCAVLSSEMLVCTSLRTLDAV